MQLLLASDEVADAGKHTVLGRAWRLEGTDEGPTTRTHSGGGTTVLEILNHKSWSQNGQLTTSRYTHTGEGRRESASLSLLPPNPRFALGHRRLL